MGSAGPVVGVKSTSTTPLRIPGKLGLKATARMQTVPAGCVASRAGGCACIGEVRNGAASRVEVECHRSGHNVRVGYVDRRGAPAHIRGLRPDSWVAQRNGCRIRAWDVVRVSKVVQGNGVISGHEVCAVKQEGYGRTRTRSRCERARTEGLTIEGHTDRTGRSGSAPGHSYVIRGWLAEEAAVTAGIIRASR